MAQKGRSTAPATGDSAGHRMQMALHPDDIELSWSVQATSRRELRHGSGVSWQARPVTVGGDNSGIVSAGDHTINIQLGAGPVRSPYLRQVRRIAPLELHAREAELAQLAAFCTSDGGGYTWWRATAWSGKSALMSWFVLHPPPGVRIVSFFITARLAAQNDHVAFTENVLEQLLALLGESLPPLLTEHTREGHLHDRLITAAESCRSIGERLVLLVDGLDEDRATHDHSIAALLPAELRGDLRVIVASRPNPRIPDDVREDHPLRDPTIIRSLAPSPRAQVIRVEMQKDLKRLLTGSAAEQDLLGLLTAAGGGLTTSDLAWLTGEHRWQIDDRLATITGRSFSTRDPYYEAGGPEAFLLGHEELHVTAVELIGPDRLADYRDRLHSWAQHYRSQHWPADTPEYLLVGYFRMLLATDGIPEMLACATDIHRQDRLRDRSGSDTAALTEITTAMGALAACSRPDLVALTRLSIHRARLANRNPHIPVDLPVAWAFLGEFDRAGSTASLITDPGARTRAQAGIANELAAAGERQQAIELLARIEPAVRHIGSATSLTEAAAAWMAVGDDDRAIATLDAIEQAGSHGAAVKQVIAALAARDVDRAEDLAYSVIGRVDQAQALTSVARVLAMDGRTDHLAEVVDRVRELLLGRAKSLGQHSATDVRTLVSLINASRSAGCPNPAADLRRWAEQITDDLLGRDGAAAGLTWAECEVDGMYQCATTRTLAEAWAEAGDLDRAEEIAEIVPSKQDRATALIAVAHGHGVAGQISRAAGVLARAELLARTAWHQHDDPDTMVEDHANTLESVAVGLAEIGDFSSALRIANAITVKRRSAGTLAYLARQLASAGRQVEARQLLLRAERATLSTAGPGSLARELALAAAALAETGDTAGAAQVIDRAGDITPFAANDEHTAASLATAMALCGDPDRAQEIGLSVSDLPTRIVVLVKIAERFAQLGHVDRVIDVVGHLTRLAPAVTTLDGRSVLMSTVRRLVEFGRVDEAELFAVTASESVRLDLLSEVATAAARTSTPELAADLIARIERLTGLAERVTGVSRQRAEKRLAPSLVEAFALAGEIDRAEAALRLVHDDDPVGLREDGLAGLARGLAATGQLDRAKQVIESYPLQFPRAKAWSLVAYEAAAAGRVDRAVLLAFSITEWDVRTPTLTSVARVSAQAGDRDAERVARMIGNGRVRGEVLMTLARNASEVAEVLMLADWQVALPAVVRTAPEALVTILDELAAVYAVG